MKYSVPFDTTIDECESTNDLAKKLGEEGAPHGTWISSRHQTHGRGRMGREWKPLEGNLYLSFIARVSDATPITWLPLQAALACVEAVRELKPSLELKIKWPNDLVFRDLTRTRETTVSKAGGILCEGVGSRAGTFVVVGIGLNCADSPEVDQPTSSLGVDVDRLRPILIEKLKLELDPSRTQSQENTRDLIRRYLAHSLFQPGDPIEWLDLRDPTQTLHSGHFEGIGRLGELLAFTDEGTKPLYSEEVKLKLR